MHSSIRLTGAIALLTIGWLAASPANSAGIVIVSRFGSDGPGCATASNPCLTLNQAIQNVDPSGIVVIEDRLFPPGDATIDKSATIIGGLVQNPGGPCIIFNGGRDDTLTLRDFICDQGGTSNPGILFNSGHKLNLFESTVQNGAGGAFGVDINTRTNSELNIVNSTITGNGSGARGGGIRIDPRRGADVTGIINNTVLQNNSTALRLNAGDGSNVNVIIDNTTVTGNRTAFDADGTGADFSVFRSTFGDNLVVIDKANGAKARSGGDNNFSNNGTDGAFTSTIGKK